MLDALATLIETQIQTTPELAAPLRLRMQRIFKTEDHTAPPSDLYEQAIGYASVLLALDLKEKGRQSATTLSAISAARRFVKAQMATAMEMAKENKAA